MALVVQKITVIVVVYLQKFSFHELNMTPALVVLQKTGIPHQVHHYDHDPSCTDFGREAAENLRVDPVRIFKTLIARGDDGLLVMAIISVKDRLDLKLLAKTLGCKKADLADPEIAEKTTGYVVGGISPLGCRKSLPTYLDQSALTFETIFISAGKRGLQVELSPVSLSQLTKAETADLVMRTSVLGD